MAEHSEWHDVVGLPPITSYELEWHVKPRTRKTLNWGRLGLPRLDALTQHADGTVGIVEAKLTTTPGAVSSALGQILYYKMLMEKVSEAKIDHLILAIPLLPAWVVDLCDEYRLPVRILKVTGNHYIGGIPGFLRELTDASAQERTP